MKVSFAASVFCCLLLLSRYASADAAAPGRLLILEVSSADAAAGARLQEMTPDPSERMTTADARDPRFVRAALVVRGARRAAVLDGERRGVQVLRADGSVRSRQIEGEPTAYQVAFVASELLALDAASPEVEPAAPQARPPSHFARFDGQLALDVARAYTTAAVVRPKLGLALWLAGARQRRVLALLGAELAGPARTERSFGELGDVSVVRWDAALRLGIACPFGRLRLLAAGRGHFGGMRAHYSAEARDEGAWSMGLGLGTGLELGLSSWFALWAGVDLDVMLRRNLFTVRDTDALREPLLFVSGGLGIVLSTPWR